jgi:hypothetical protein
VGGLGPVYTAPSTGASFVVNTTLDNSESAESSCKANGGHLAAYTSEQEQVGRPPNWQAGPCCCGRYCDPRYCKRLFMGGLSGLWCSRQALPLLLLLTAG